MTVSETRHQIQQQIEQLPPAQLQQVAEFLTELQHSSEPKSEWDNFAAMLQRNKVSTGIPDLAHQHDHYLHGKPKQDPSDC